MNFKEAKAQEPAVETRNTLPWQWYVQHACGGLNEKTGIMTEGIGNLLSWVGDTYGLEMRSQAESRIPEAVIMASELCAVIEEQKKGMTANSLVAGTIKMFPDLEPYKDELTPFAEAFLKTPSPLKRFEGNALESTQRGTEKQKDDSGFNKLAGVLGQKFGLSRSPVLVTPEGIKIPWDTKDRKGENLVNLRLGDILPDIPGLDAVVATLGFLLTSYMSVTTTSKFITGGESNPSGWVAAGIFNTLQYTFLSLISRGSDIDRSGAATTLEKVTFGALVFGLTLSWLIEFYSNYTYVGVDPQDPLIRGVYSFLIGIGPEVSSKIAVKSWQRWRHNVRSLRGGEEDQYSERWRNI